MNFHESIRAILARLKERYGADIEAGKAEAVRRVRACPAFAGEREKLIDYAITRLYYEQRHLDNRGVEGGLPASGEETPAAPRRGHAAARVVVANSPECQRVAASAAASIYSLQIGSTMLGELTGEQLPALSEQFTRIRGGYQVKEGLLRWLVRQRVPAGVKVRDHVPEGHLAAAYRRLRRAVDRAA
jgi:hypothetical protein